MRVNLLALTLLAAASTALAAPLPRLPASAATPNALIPNGWEVQQRLRADFEASEAQGIL